MYFCDAPAKNKAFRTLVLPVLDYASECGIPTHTSTAEKKIMELVGCVVAGTTVKVTYGLSRLVNVVSSTGHLFLHDVSISQ